MNKIVPHLWFDHQAEEAAALYTSVFQDGRLGRVARYGKATEKVSGKPEGSVMTVEFSVGGQDFVALNGGPHFRLTPAISFLVRCASAAEFESLWKALSDGGSVLMEPGNYGFSERYGWLEDRYGVSWQLTVGGDRQEVTPFLMFCGDHNGEAEAAMKEYTSVFENSAMGAIQHSAEGKVQFATFTLAGQPFVAIDGGGAHDFTFTPAVSLLVNCDSQAEVDELWTRLSANPKAEQCGWLEDRFGVSWQIAPSVLNEMLLDPDRRKVERVLEVMLPMKKIELDELQRAFLGVQTERQS